MLADYSHLFFKFLWLLSIYAAGYYFDCSRTYRKLKDLITIYRNLCRDLSEQIEQIENELNQPRFLVERRAAPPEGDSFYV